MTSDQTLALVRGIAIARLSLPLHAAVEALEQFLWKDDGVNAEQAFALLGQEGGQLLAVSADLKKLLKDLFPKCTPASLQPAAIATVINGDGTVSLTKAATEKPVVEAVTLAQATPTAIQPAENATAGANATAAAPGTQDGNATEAKTV